MEFALDIEGVKKRPYAYRGYESSRNGWLIPRPANPHAHLRDPIEQPELFDLVVPESAKIYDWVTAMPNLAKNRIRTPEQAIAYRKKILNRGRLFNTCFDVTVPLYLEPDTDPEIVRAGFKAGAWKTAKIYPKSGTTNSDDGVDFRRIHDIFPALEAMQQLGMLCLVHSEVVHDSHDHLIADRKREPLAIPVIDTILREFPHLRLVPEHISSAEMIAAAKGWKSLGYHVEPTIAPQYLVWNSTMLFERGMNPVNFSIPILKDEEDRVALVEFMIGGGGMLGTDSAPHPIQSKSKPRGCAGGVFNEPVGLFIYFHVFRMYGGEDWFEKFVEFACRKACRFYREPQPTGMALITEEPWDVPRLYTDQERTVDVIPMCSGMRMPYSYKLLTAE